MSITLQVLILKSNSEFDKPATTDGEKWKGAMGYLSSCPYWFSSSWGRHHEALDYVTLLVEWQSDGATHEFLRNYYTKFAALLDPLLGVLSSLPQVVDLHQSIVKPYVVPGGYALGSTIVRKLIYDSLNDSQRLGMKTAFSLYDQSLAQAADGDAAGYIAGTAAWALDTNKNPTSTLWVLVSWESLDAELSFPKHCYAAPLASLTLPATGSANLLAMSGITREQRSRGWNVKFFIGKDASAGIYQRDNLLTIGDVARDLELCIVFSNLPNDTDDWQAVLLPRRVDATPTDMHIHIALDKANMEPFPGPTIVMQYTYLFHSSSRCALPSGQPHSPTSPCYHKPLPPTRRYNPRHAAISKPSSTSRSRHPSTSSTPSEIENEEIPVSIITPETARGFMGAFRSNLLGTNPVCAISGKGKSWVDGLPGTGIEAAHIVPQIHWAVYPLDAVNSAGLEERPSVEDRPRLEMAWRRTWMSSNGLPLLSHLHKCFEARLVSIHPSTRRVRAFVEYDILTEHNGQQAHLPPAIDTDAEALQYHYDMCCIENMIAAWIPDATALLDRREAPLVAPQQNAPAGSTSGQGTIDNSRDASGQETSTRQTSVSQDIPPASGHTTHPPSPPPSNVGGPRWMCGAEVIDDLQEAAELLKHGWILQEVGAGEEERGRSSKRRRCTTTDADSGGDNEQPSKKQRLAVTGLSPDSSND
ncbi:hypothetical protein M406DRAFT_69295 [Cryphonectria parasitica EP155]|uniref:HNH nuclease domain-containing protein n=1 Tax=Cryphonectria parasitica (strain ATCC 38755 / EP155) TaxID=660469 RepID=A0A9P4Y5M2_CRYP1|nr:uncharacterized protein M406DRAFT_69295 [Cryphonectria parasitica EP155]KAF3767131.1 hypothetical protein M406DRAFT_69295 [Cryphonectria parasitica EP155]